MSSNEGMPAKILATFIDVSLARVGQLAKEGVITKMANGRYQNSAITQYIRFLRAPKENKEVNNLQEEYLRQKTLKIIKDREHREILIERTLNNLIPMNEVREMYARVFSAYRQATREIEKRYGVDASSILTQAERSALRVEVEELNQLEAEAATEREKRSGRPCAAKRAAQGRSRSSQRKKS
jgi:hypothetical protein